MTIYLDLLQEFNERKLRAIMNSGQAVVMHGLAFMSKDGDWILRETEEVMSHVLAVLERHDAFYRFGAPLDIRWMQGGWSSHFEFRSGALRVRTDFVTRPPRISENELARMWKKQDKHYAEVGPLHVLELRLLADIKKTMREKDYPIIGEIARRLKTTKDILLYSRSARDIVSIAKKHPDAVATLVSKRPALAAVKAGRSALEKALDEERRILMQEDESRIEKYLHASEPWLNAWPAVEKKLSGRRLSEAHQIVQDEASRLLPFEV